MSETKFAVAAILIGLVAVLVFFTAQRSPGPVADPMNVHDEKVATPAPPRSAVTNISEPSTITRSKPLAASGLVVDGEGLRWFLQPSGSARPLPFGSPQAAVIASIESVRGLASKGTNQDCGAGPVEYATWRDGLSLVFQNNRLAGWGLSSRAKGAIATAAGVGPGSTRAELESAYNTIVSRTSLGYEFSAGALHGVIDGPSASARITDMWGGVSCVAR